MRAPRRLYVDVDWLGRRHTYAALFKDTLFYILASLKRSKHPHNARQDTPIFMSELLFMSCQDSLRYIEDHQCARGCTPLVLKCVFAGNLHFHMHLRPSVPESRLWKGGINIADHGFEGKRTFSAIFFAISHLPSVSKNSDAHKML